MNILLTGARHLVASDLARDLHAAGHRVVTADSVSFDYVRGSRSVISSGRYASARFKTADFIEDISRIIFAHAIDQIIPLGEEAHYLAAAHTTLHEHFPQLLIHSGTAAQLEQLHDKHSLYLLAQDLGLLVPQSFLVTSPKQVLSRIKNSSATYVLKPLFSRFALGQVCISRSHHDGMYSLDWSKPFLLQRYIEGELVSSYSFSRNDEVICYSTTLPTSTASAMTNAVRQQLPEEIAHVDAAIRSHTGYDGQLGLDFIHSHDNKYYLIEANPRATLGYSLSHRPRVQSRLLMFHALVSGWISWRRIPQFICIFLFYPDTLFRMRDPMPGLLSQLGGLQDFLRFRKIHGGGSREYASFDMQYDGNRPEFHVDVPTAADNTSLLKLLEQRPARARGTEIIYTRRPDVIASIKSEGDVARLGVIKSDPRTIIMMIACTIDRYLLHGKQIKIGYLSDLRKRSDLPYAINWLELFQQQFQDLSHQPLMFSVLASNQRMIEIISKPHHALPAPKKLVDYTLFVINPKKIKPVHMSPYQFVLVHSLTHAQVEDVLDFIQQEGARFDLFPCIDNLSTNRFGVTRANSYILRDDSKILGFISINDRRDHKQYRIKQYPWYFPRPALVNPLLLSMRLMPLPATEEVINCPALSFALARDNDPAIFRTLIWSAATIVAASQAHMCMLTLPANSPHAVLFKSAYHMKIPNHLYWASGGDSVAMPTNTYTETTLFF